MILLVIAIIVSVPFAVFALSNMQHVQLGLWPFDYSIEVPVSLAILVGMAVGLLLGGALVWVAEIAQRRRARRAERTSRQLQAQIEALQARLGPTHLSLPPP
ncbi:lipopolysaccharide assembly protein LapA domain-containing protein [Rhodopila sp.]|jgi:uncharacterized integral membrane protein|uniref:lipopolysaccharide assembly protein LapA domain-containing protein n=1 Tax=Rhodopila sp. TaxID=2480087 RepID=UPI002CD3E2C7|nr:lipopolysaccharide assembly protein LapA domain-containing protein [Rhodopila sp.]HVZ10099.1 lipopolysaccharide assembly protein LapA domain-containing protein [Rhodopila sp.]